MTTPLLGEAITADAIVVHSRIAPHLPPILRAARAGDVAYLPVFQGEHRPFWPRRDLGGKPCVVIVGDDDERSLGPDAFHAKSLKRLFRDCGRVIISVITPTQLIYGLAPMWAWLWRGTAVIIECLPETQDQWIRFALKAGRRPSDFNLAIDLKEPPTALDTSKLIFLDVGEPPVETRH